MGGWSVLVAGLWIRCCRLLSEWPHSKITQLALNDQKWGAKQTSLFRRGIEGNGVDIVLIGIPHVLP